MKNAVLSPKVEGPARQDAGAESVQVMRTFSRPPTNPPECRKSHLIHAEFSFRRVFTECNQSNQFRFFIEKLPANWLPDKLTVCCVIEGAESLCGNYHAQRPRHRESWLQFERDATSRQHDLLTRAPVDSWTCLTPVRLCQRVFLLQEVRHEVPVVPRRAARQQTHGDEHAC